MSATSHGGSILTQQHQLKWNSKKERKIDEISLINYCRVIARLRRCSVVVGMLVRESKFEL
jgi:hypothetical protein